MSSTRSFVLAGGRALAPKPPSRNVNLPLIRVDCKDCGAQAGTFCQTVNGSRVSSGHRARRHAAARLHAEENGYA